MVIIKTTSSMRRSVNPFSQSAPSFLEDPGESFFETNTHCSSEKAMPITAQTGISISAPRSGNIEAPILKTIHPLEGSGWKFHILCMSTLDLDDGFTICNKFTVLKFVFLMEPNPL